MLYGRDRTSTTGYGYNQRTPEPLDESTQKLFDAIGKENLEDFKHSIEVGADVNSFDKGYTPLVTIVMNDDDSPICLKMMMLLLQHKSLNINAKETKECNTALHLAFLMENRNFVQMLLRRPSINTNIKNKVFLLQDKYLGPEHDGIRAHLIEDAQCKQCFFYTPQEYIEKIGKVQGKDFLYLTMEISEAQRGKNFLESFSFLASSSIWITQILLNHNNKPNPNCWERNQNGEIETPLSLIIKSCLQGITQDNEEVLTKLLKYKDLDFSQIKPIQDIEKNPWVKQIIEQAITERLTDTINRKDLDDVKKLVEDNCFMNHAVVTAALRGVDNPVNSIKDYLSGKFPVSVEQPVASTNIPAGFKEFAQEPVDELEKVKAQRNDLNSEVTRLNRIVYGRADDISPGRKQSNYASASFVLSGAFAVGACLAVLYDYPGIISAFFTAVALVLFLVGYYLCKADERDIGPGSATDNPQVTRVLTFSPNSAENSYTY